MKKAFTLIELLVVIAIIAILAAILFPVFAQAKTAAKKAASISNQKQIGLAIIMYQESYDDTYPRNDDCTLNDSLNGKFNNQAAGTNPTPWCTGSPSFAFRDNHYSWQKWVRPYTKNVQIFDHPAMLKDQTSWDRDGEIFNTYALNLSLTGALNTWGTAAGSAGRFRDSFLGGKQTSVPDVSQAMLLMELASPTINFAPVFLDSTSGTEARRAYPVAIRELWIPYFYKQVSAPCNYGTTLDNTKVPFAGNMNVSFCDGHTASMNIGKWLAQTPTAAEYRVSSRWPCAPDGGAWTVSGAPAYDKPWPMWALQ